VVIAGLASWYGKPITRTNFWQVVPEPIGVRGEGNSRNCSSSGATECYSSSRGPELLTASGCAYDALLYVGLSDLSE
jgi:hypothetical protein